MPTVAKVFNLDEVRCNYVEISKTVNGQVKTWRLRDDVETTTLLRGFEIQLLPDRIRAIQEAATAEGRTVTPAVLTAEIRAYEADIRDFFLDIARWTLPEDEAVELADLLTHLQRDAIVYHFFSSRFVPSSVLPSASAPNPEDDEAGTDVTAPAPPPGPNTPPGPNGRTKRTRAGM